jgi:hypothetical protein
MRGVRVEEPFLDSMISDHPSQDDLRWDDPVERGTAVAMFRRPCITKSEVVASRLIGVAYASPYGTGDHRLPAAAALIVFTSGTSRGSTWRVARAL